MPCQTKSKSCSTRPTTASALAAEQRKEADMNTEEAYKPALFEGRQIRKAFHEGEWWFSIIDVVEVLVGGDRPRKYWNDLKKKLAAEGYFEVSEKIGQLKMAAPDGKQRLTDCANTETLFRVIQSMLTTLPCKQSCPSKVVSALFLLLSPYRQRRLLPIERFAACPRFKSQRLPCAALRRRAPPPVRGRALPGPVRQSPSAAG